MKNTIWPKTNNADSNQTIEELSIEAKDEGKVLILFPEGCSSNGESFLESKIVFISFFKFFFFRFLNFIF
jgi:1-acyl-sn-glycerol-3-phosphate acyltransferase